MESTKQRLNQLEEQKELWRKHCKEEDKRIEDEYNREFAEIQREYEEASRLIELEFQTKRAALKQDKCKITNVEPSSECASPQTVSLGVVEQNEKDTEQVNSVPPLISRDRHRNISAHNQVERRPNNPEPYTPNVADSIQIGAIRCILCGTCDECVFCVVKTTAVVVFFGFDPGGEHTYNSLPIGAIYSNK